MSLSRYSELAIIATLVAVVLTAGAAGAVSVTDESVQSEAAVGDEVTATVELQDLYEDRDAYDLKGLTALEDATWTVQEYDGDEPLDESQYEGEEFVHEGLDSSRDPAPTRVRVEVTGTVPDVEEFSYDSEETFDGLRLGMVYDGGGQEFDTWSIHHYTTGDDTAGSREARTALDDARSTIDQASDDGQDVSDAESRFEDAVGSYNEGSFEEAVAAAEEATSQLDESATDSRDSTTDDSGADASDASDASDAETSDEADDAGAEPSDDEDEDGSGVLTLLLYGLGFVALVAVVGGVLYLRQQQTSPNRDPLG